MMDMKKILEGRRSVREYRDKKIKGEIIEEVFESVLRGRRLTKEVEVELYFIEDGVRIAEGLQGLAGYHGKVIEAPHYVAICSKKGEGYIENAGYMGERIVLEAKKRDLGTCWIEVPRDDEKIHEILGIKNDMEIMGLLAIGYPKAEGWVSNVGRGSISPLTELGYPNMEIKYRNQPISERKSIEEIVYLKRWGRNAKVEDLENRGLEEAFYFMRLAPSWGNRQPWKFILDGGRIVLAIKKDEDVVNEKIARLEAGIVMLYLELMIMEKGMAGAWVLGDVDKDYGVPEDYFIAGYFSL